MGGTFSRPLLRNAGFKAEMESLTQAERDLLYAVRDFARFRQEFTVRICSEYYGVLQSRDAVRNNWLSYRSFIKNAERQRAFAEEAKATQAEVRRLVRQLDAPQLAQREAAEAELLGRGPAVLDLLPPAGDGERGLNEWNIRPANG